MGCRFLCSLLLAVATNFSGRDGYTVGTVFAGGGKVVYLDLVMVLNFAVDFLLLMGTNGLSGFPVAPKRAALAAALGGVYGGMCLLPGFRFLGGTVWRLVFLALMSVMAFGWNRSALRRGTLFVLLSMALGGIALGLGDGGVSALLGSAAGIALLCSVGFYGKAGGRKYTKVELVYRGKRRALTALCDTGNTLRDPVTGEQVLVVGADVAEELLGLTPQALASPVETMTKAQIPGLRLIPYRAVGQPCGMLLAMKMEEVRIAGRLRGDVVAFAPQKLGNEGYEALAGGSL